MTDILTFGNATFALSLPPKTPTLLHSLVLPTCPSLSASLYHFREKNIPEKGIYLPSAFHPELQRYPPTLRNPKLGRGQSISSYEAIFPESEIARGLRPPPGNVAPPSAPHAAYFYSTRGFLSSHPSQTFRTGYGCVVCPQRLRSM